MRAIVIGLLLSLSSMAAWGKIYKWVDANGQTHFSSQPPTGAHSQEMRSNGGAASDSSSSAETGSVSGGNDALDCDLAIAHMQSSIVVLNTVIRWGYEAGDLSDDLHKQAQQRAKVLGARISKPQCEASTGNLRKFYACMDHSGEAVALFACGAKYDKDSKIQDFQETLNRPVLYKVIWAIYEKEGFGKEK